MSGSDRHRSPSIECLRQSASLYLLSSDSTRQSSRRHAETWPDVSLHNMIEVASIFTRLVIWGCECWLEPAPAAKIV